MKAVMRIGTLMPHLLTSSGMRWWGISSLPGHPNVPYGKDTGHRPLREPMAKRKEGLWGAAWHSVLANALCLQHLDILPSHFFLFRTPSLPMPPPSLPPPHHSPFHLHPFTSLLLLLAPPSLTSSCPPFPLLFPTSSHPPPPPIPLLLFLYICSFYSLSLLI
jgi:hypothetical protein